MELIEISGQARTSRILVGARLRDLPEHLPHARCVVITDSNIKARYHDLLRGYDLIELPAGEQAKSLATVEKIYAELLRYEADRSTFLVGVGGGVVCDLTGFAASTYLRGLEFGFVATSLLAQVDGSLGGKNAVNLQGFKNLVGTFNQPSFVICDLGLLETLPEREFVNGLAEVIKHALIGDPELFSFLERDLKEGARHDQPFLQRIVHDSIAVKAAIVGRDEREAGERRVLNFGHTLGHAIERTADLLHGEAIGLGMAFAVRYSNQRGLLGRPSCERILALLRRMKLPVDAGFDRRSALDAMRKDKKREADRVHFVFLKEIGAPEIEAISLDELEGAVRDLC